MPTAEPSQRAAVAACARALAETDVYVDAPPHADAAVLRAAGDRAAIRRRWHDATCHRAHRPSDALAAQLFDALEAARLDALGVAWLPGVAGNLLRSPDNQENLVRWLTFQVLSGMPAPGELAPHVGQRAATMPDPLRAGLTSLVPLVARQAEFDVIARRWAEAAVRHEWGRGVAMRVAAPRGSRPRSDGLPREAAPVAEQAVTRDGKNGRQLARDLAAGPRPSLADQAADARYRAFTTLYDQVVDARALVRPTELAALRDRLDTELGETRIAVTRLTNRLRRMLMARQVRRWHFDMDEGAVDGGRLASVVASPRDTRPFKQEAESPFPTAAVTLLLDCSGSMRGRPILVAALAIEVVTQALERCGIACEVLGFTTREWDGGLARIAWEAAGAPPHPGRLSALEHIVFKSADVPWRRARHGLGLVLHDELLKENVDGEAVQWARGRLLRRPERRKLLLVISDGEPRDEATEQTNGREYLGRHLRTIVGEIEERSPAEIAAIGIGHDVLRFYSRAVSIGSAEELGEAVSLSLASLLTRRRNSRRN